MGRPLNKRLFGVPDDGTGANAGKGLEIKVNFHNGTAVKEGYIVKQKGSKKFVCEEIGTAGLFTCVLKTGVLPAALTSTGTVGQPDFLGEMSISVQGSDSETYGVSKISGRKVTLVAPSSTGPNALAGTSIKYALTGSAAAGIVRMEEAGDDNTLSGTDDDDFTEDA